MNSQYEINIEHSDALDAADRAFLLKTTVKELAARQGMVATFMGKPFNDQGGSGFHLHLSLADGDGANAFDGGAPGLGAFAAFVAGILEHGPALMALLAPTVNAYKRLVPDSLAPTHVNWGLDNRTAFVRVPHEARLAQPGRGSRRRRQRLRRTSRSPALLLAGPRRDRARARAARAGRRRRLPCRRGARRARGFRPTSAPPLDALEADDVAVRRARRRSSSRRSFAMKRFELDRFTQWVTDWELDEYARHL